MARLEFEVGGFGTPNRGVERGLGLLTPGLEVIVLPIYRVLPGRDPVFPPVCPSAATRVQAGGALGRGCTFGVSHPPINIGGAGYGLHQPPGTGKENLHFRRKSNS